MSRSCDFWRLRIHEELASTQDEVLAAAKAGEPAGLAIMARRQSAGRGTQGRVWHAPDGNLSLSVLLRPSTPARDIAQWALLTAVALGCVLASTLPSTAAMTFKWPNDVLLDGGKVAGILAEAALDQDRVAWLVLGIGVNLSAAPELQDRPSACLADVAPPPLPENFADRLLPELARWSQLAERDGFAMIRQAWLKRGPVLGSPLKVRAGKNELAGTFLGLDERGRLLLLEDRGGTHVVAAGEVWH
ncbi:biotin--[acetyl-CoA-carboxylase] ligase [Pseudoroseomonas globiformis]|uniref:biotin--[biotin carboxyl-carrier protein] ligase n=1 Tax=Teichococcus globiformis TaxID=2307229 RepID=A0ABV7FYM6_9PROT